MSEAAAVLGIEHAIVQGPFGGGLSTPKLVSTVSNLGGLGSFGAEHLQPDVIPAVVKEIKALTDKPFNMNLWVEVYDPGGLEIDEAEFERLWALFKPYYDEMGVAKPERPKRYHHAFEDQVEALLAAEPPVMSFIFGVPRPEILAECRRRGIVTAGGATTLAEAEMLDDAGVDVIVATGFEAGGHRISFLKSAEESLMGTFVLTQLVSRRVKRPVIAAGGVCDGRGRRAAEALGAAGVQVGTAFLATEESGASAAHKASLFSDQARETTLTRAYSGRLGRSLANRWSQTVPAPFAPYPIQNWFTAKLKPAQGAAGRNDLVSIWGGQIAPNLVHRTAAGVMDELVNG